MVLYSAGYTYIHALGWGQFSMQNYPGLKSIASFVYIIRGILKEYC